MITAWQVYCLQAISKHIGDDAFESDAEAAEFFAALPEYAQKEVCEDAAKLGLVGRA